MVLATKFNCMPNLTIPKSLLLYISFSHCIMEILYYVCLEYMYLLVRCIPDIQQLTTQWKHSILVSTHNTQATDSQRFGRVSLSQNKCTLLGIPTTCIISIIKFRNATNFTVFALLAFLVELSLEWNVDNKILS